MPLISALRRQADFWVQDSEFQESKGYTEKHCIKKTKTKNILTVEQSIILLAIPLLLEIFK